MNQIIMSNNGRKKLKRALESSDIVADDYVPKSPSRVREERYSLLNRLIERVGLGEVESILHYAFEQDVFSLIKYDSLNALDDNVLGHIFGFILRNSWTSLMFVCKRWYKLVRSTHMWLPRVSVWKAGSITNKADLFASHIKPFAAKVFNINFQYGYLAFIHQHLCCWSHKDVAFTDKCYNIHLIEHLYTQPISSYHCTCLNNRDVVKRNRHMSCVITINLKLGFTQFMFSHAAEKKNRGDDTHIYQHYGKFCRIRFFHAKGPNQYSIMQGTMCCEHLTHIIVSEEQHTSTHKDLLSYFNSNVAIYRLVPHPIVYSFVRRHRESETILYEGPCMWVDYQFEPHSPNEVVKLLHYETQCEWMGYVCVGFPHGQGIVTNKDTGAAEQVTAHYGQVDGQHWYTLFTTNELPLEPSYSGEVPPEH